MDRSKWILAMGIVAMMLAVGVFIPADTDVEGETPTADSSWYNSSQTSFDIYDVGDLLAFAEAVNGKDGGTAVSFNGKIVNLRGSLDLGGLSWVPIGNSKRTSTIDGNQTGIFSGTFNGNGYSISNLSSSGYVPGTSSLDNTKFLYGLFGFTYNAKISNLTVSVSINVESVTSNDETYVGDSVAPLVGYGLGTLEITNVTTSGSVKANDAAAGVVGRFYGTNLTISGCTSLTNVESGGKVGGITSITSSAVQKIVITNCINGTIGGSDGQINGENAGGIIGYTGGNAGTTINITGSTNNGKISATGCSGGIIGYDASCDKTIEVSGCSNSGLIQGGTGVGGIMGISQSKCTVDGCTNTGNVGEGDAVGGIVGSLNNYTLEVKSCRVSGSPQISGTNMAGGILGRAGGTSGTLDSCSVSATTSVTTSNHSMSENQGSVYQGAVNGWAIGSIRETQLTVKNMSETGGKYEFIAAVYFNSNVTVTFKNCQTTTLMTWGGNAGTMNLVLENSTIAGLEMYQRGLKITADATSTIGKLIAGADSSILGSGTQPFTPSAVQITVATNTNLRLSNEAASYYSSTFTGESGSKYTVLTSTSASTKEWDVSTNAWGSLTTAEIVAAVQYSSVTTYYTSLGDAVSVAPSGAAINVLKSVDCVETDGKKLTFTGATLKHTPVTVPGMAATCKDTGLTDGKECSVCGAIIEEQKIIEKTEHQWDSGVITTQPTKDHEGVRTYTCSVCGATKTEAVPKLCTHVWDSGKVTSNPTCGTAGEKTFECVKCHQTKTEVVAATGNHSWNDGEDTGSGIIRYMCSECGTTKTAKIESDKTEVVEDGVRTTTETQKIEEESKDGTKTVTETTIVSKEENGAVEKTETTKSTTTSGNTTIESETTVTEKAGEKVETSKSTTITEEKTTIVSDATVIEKAGQKTETIAVTIRSEDEKVTTDVSVSDGSTSGIKTVVTGEVTDDVIASAVKQVDMATEAISDKVAEVSKTISVDTHEVTLSPSTFGTIASSGVSLTITGDAGSIGIDSSVAVTMTSQDEDVTISINEKKDGLTDAQKQKAGENKVIELSARTATKDIHELGGTAMVRIDMTGMEYKSPAVYWLKDDGTSVKVDAEFGDGYAAVELSHFSLYYIAEAASSTTFIIIPDTSDDDFPGYVPTPSSNSTDSGSNDTAKIAVLVGAIVVLLVAMVALTHKSR